MYRKAGMYGILLSRSHPFSPRWCPIVKSCGIPAPVVPRINDAIHQIKLLYKLWWIMLSNFWTTGARTMPVGHNLQFPWEKKTWIKWLSIFPSQYQKNGWKFLPFLPIILNMLQSRGPRLNPCSNFSLGSLSFSRSVVPSSTSRPGWYKQLAS